MHRTERHTEILDVLDVDATERARQITDGLIATAERIGALGTDAVTTKPAQPALPDKSTLADNLTGAWDWGRQTASPGRIAAAEAAARVAQRLRATTPE